MAINPAEEGKIFAAEAKAQGKPVEKWKKLKIEETVKVLDEIFGIIH